MVANAESERYMEFLVKKIQSLAPHVNAQLENLRKEADNSKLEVKWLDEIHKLFREFFHGEMSNDMHSLVELEMAIQEYKKTFTTKRLVVRPGVFESINLQLKHLIVLEGLYELISAVWALRFLEILLGVVDEDMAQSDDDNSEFDNDN